METETIYGQIIAKANHYQAVPGKFGAKRIIKDEKIRAYEKSFMQQCRVYRNKGISSRFRLFVRVYHSSVRFDLDNSLKTLLDCLQMVGAITDDKLCFQIEAENMPLQIWQVHRVTRKLKKLSKNGIRKQMWIDIGPCVLPILQHLTAWAFKLPTMPLINPNNGTAEQNLKRWLMRFWDITPTLTRITETTHMMTGLYIVTVEAAIEKVVRQLRRNVAILLI